MRKPARRRGQAMGAGSAGRPVGACAEQARRETRLQRSGVLQASSAPSSCRPGRAAGLFRVAWRAQRLQHAGLIECMRGAQVLRHADVLHYMGLIDTRQRICALQQQLEVAELMTLGARPRLPACVGRVSLTYPSQIPYPTHPMPACA